MLQLFEFYADAMQCCTWMKHLINSAIIQMWMEDLLASSSINGQCYLMANLFNLLNSQSKGFHKWAVETESRPAPHKYLRKLGKHMSHSQRIYGTDQLMKR